MHSPDCSTPLSPLDVAGSLGLGYGVRPQDVDGFVGPYIQWNQSITAAGIAAGAANIANAASAPTITLNDLNVTRRMPNNGKYFYLIKALKFTFRGAAALIEPDDLSTLIAGTYLAHTPKGLGEYDYPATPGAEIDLWQASQNVTAAAAPGTANGLATHKGNFRDILAGRPLLVDAEDDVLSIVCPAVAGLPTIGLTIHAYAVAISKTSDGDAIQRARAHGNRVLKLPYSGRN